jgi:hypothetical protein
MGSFCFDLKSGYTSYMTNEGLDAAMQSRPERPKYSLRLIQEGPHVMKFLFDKGSFTDLTSQERQIIEQTIEYVKDNLNMAIVGRIQLSTDGKG